MMMQTDRVAIVGAGPSGAFLARLLSDAGYKVTVFEALPKLAVKPCGWGVPFTIDRVVKIPEDYIISEVHGYRVYIDEEKLLESKGVKYGYIVDKERLLEHFLEGSRSSGEELESSGSWRATTSSSTRGESHLTLGGGLARCRRSLRG
ncbi:MAG: NAD(P)-binding protein [Thermofilum sp.]